MPYEYLLHYNVYYNLPNMPLDLFTHGHPDLTLTIFFVVLFIIFRFEI